MERMLQLQSNTDVYSVSRGDFTNDDDDDGARARERKWTTVVLTSSSTTMSCVNLTYGCARNVLVVVQKPPDEKHNANVATIVPTNATRRTKFVADSTGA